MKKRLMVFGPVYAVKKQEGQEQHLNIDHGTLKSTTANCGHRIAIS